MSSIGKKASVVPWGPSREPSSRPEGVDEILGALGEDVRELILKYRRTSYVSASNVDGKPTGNRYQAIELGGTRVKGFRGGRALLFSKIRFEGATVLDIGCNTGELSRLARRHGAALVDGFDYDPFWIAIGRLVNAANGVTRVSLYVADATTEDAYCGEYDIVLGFSVFPYMTRALESVVAATRRVLVLETHNLSSPAALGQYVRTLETHFPVHEIIDATDWGEGLDGERKVIVFARDQETLEAMLVLDGPRQMAPRGREGVAYGIIDVQRSRFRFLSRFEARFEHELAQGFEAVVAAASELPLNDLSDHHDVASGVAYWCAFLRGYADYVEAGSVGLKNFYVSYLRDAYAEVEFDPRLREVVEDDSRLVGRVSLRYAALDRFRKGAGMDVEPVELINTRFERDGFAVYDRSAGRWVSCERFDGYHRLFSARVTGAEELVFVCRDDPEDT